MNTYKPTNGIDPKVTLSSLWIFAVLNYLYADVYPIFQPSGQGSHDHAARGCVGIRHIDGDRDCHDPRIQILEIWRKSLGEHHRWYFSHRICGLVIDRGNANGLLRVFCERRNSLYLRQLSYLLIVSFI